MGGDPGNAPPDAKGKHIKDHKDGEPDNYIWQERDGSLRNALQSFPGRMRLAFHPLTSRRQISQANLMADRSVWGR
ncbi:hypothetical protein LMG27198_44490 [Methylocystis echinoides]|uniref:Uncharacterized protein n=1 Tax=Methylocystis echinoides TaxID=29468 RepID=A0A9W6GYH7_9HYPH|nr:hypothetical protein LMG27198_44490 [Methylocystis echinoides]